MHKFPKIEWNEAEPANKYTIRLSLISLKIENMCGACMLCGVDASMKWTRCNKLLNKHPKWTYRPHTKQKYFIFILMITHGNKSKMNKWVFNRIIATTTLYGFSIVPRVKSYWRAAALCLFPQMKCTTSTHLFHWCFNCS